MTVDADGNITTVDADDDLTGDITAGGTIDTVDADQKIESTITAGETFSMYRPVGTLREASARCPLPIM